MPLTPSDLARFDEMKQSKTWSVFRGMNGSTLIAIIGLVVAGFSAYYTLVARTEANEAETKRQKEFLMAQDAAIMAAVIRMGNQFDRMEGKVDRLIEMRKP